MKIIFKKILLGLCVLLISGCATTHHKKGIPKNEFSLKELCDQYKIAYSLDPVSQNILLTRGASSASALIGSDIVLLDNQKIILSAPLKIKRGVVIVPPDFKTRVLDALVAKIEVSKKDYTIHKIKTIVVDPGHGGKDPGAIGPSGLHEKVVVLDIAQKLSTLLKRQGFKVVMTRDSDVFIPLKDRTVIACRAKADLFVSVHANAHDKRSVNGVEVYSLKALDNLELNESERLDNHDILFKEMSMKRNDEDLKRIVSDMLYMYKQGESAALATETAQTTAGYLDARNLGAKTSHFFVLRNTLVPAILVEVGYLTNPKEESLLRTKSYREKIAQAIAKSIIEYAKDK